jgi:SAM-dependent methyltransferase
LKPWYEELFTDYAATYDREPFTQGTTAECDFLQAELGTGPGLRVLDVGCGTGRHAVELAKRGFRVTGLDLSPAQLRRARLKACQAGVTVRFVRRDARRFRFNRPFDAVIMLCEGGFPLMETDEENYRILACAARALKPGGRFIFTTLNALFPLAHSIREFVDDAGSTGVRTDAQSFDLLTFRDHSTVTVIDDSGQVRTLSCNERYYTPSEIHWLLGSLGFGEIAVHGCAPGVFTRGRQLTPDDFEMLVIARKKSPTGR